MKFLFCLPGDLRKALAGQHIYPAWIHELQARELYPALDEVTKSRISVESFAGDILKILIDAGDLKSKQVATPQGEAHGLINTDASAWSYDDNGYMDTQHCVVRGSDRKRQDVYQGLDKSSFPWA